MTSSKAATSAKDREATEESTDEDKSMLDIRNLFNEVPENAMEEKPQKEKEAPEECQISDNEARRNRNRKRAMDRAREYRGPKDAVAESNADEDGKVG